MPGQPLPAGYSDSDSDDYCYQYDQHETAKPAAVATKPKVQQESWRARAYGQKEDVRRVQPRDRNELFREAILAEDLSALSSLAVKPIPATMVFLACSNAKAKALKVLLDAGAKVDQKEDDCTPLMALAARTGPLDKEDSNAEVEVAELLLAHGAKLEERTSQRLTPLMLAARAGRQALVDKFVESGSNVDSEDSQGWSALHFSCDGGHGRVARLLLEHGADPHLATQEGFTAAELAANNGYADLQRVVEKFVEKRSLLQAEEFLPKKRQHFKRFSELDSVLLGLNASQEVVNAFKKHKIELEQFLVLRETDLSEMGVKDVGLRKAIMASISEIHKRDWSRSSLPKITPKDKQKGIYINCPDAVAMASNAKEHVTLIGSMFDFVAEQCKSHPTVLTLGADVADPALLASTLDQCAVRMRRAALKAEKLAALARRVPSGRRDAVLARAGRRAGRGIVVAIGLCTLAAVIFWSGE